MALLLVVAAVIDVRTFTISNRLNLAVALLAPLYWWSAHLPLWPDIGIQIAVARRRLRLLAGAFYAGMMGGGDVKLAAALALWFPPNDAQVPGPHVGRRRRADPGRPGPASRAKRREGRPEVPYGVAIAFGGLWLILAQRFLNQFA